MDDRELPKVLAVIAHRIPDRDPIRLELGDEVDAGAERDLDWPEFVFVHAATGSGWVPARYLSRTGGRATVTTPYDTTELPTEKGDVLEVLEDDTQSGWLWCRAGDGREGWVPIRTVAPAA